MVSKRTNTTNIENFWPGEQRVIGRTDCYIDGDRIWLRPAIWQLTSLDYVCWNISSIYMRACMINHYSTWAY